MRKHSVTLAGHRTSLSLEPEFWDALKAIAERRGCSVNSLVAELDAARLRAAQPRNLSSEVRVFVLNHFMTLYSMYGRSRNP